MRDAVHSGCAKLILFGEHAVVYGAPAIAAGLDVGARATARPGRGTLTLRAPTGDAVASVDLTPDAGDRLATAWRRIHATLGAPEGVDVDVTLEVPPGAGLGSSAALAVAASRALLAWSTGEDPDEARVAAAVEAAERTFHGNASGIDQAAALGGGLFVFERGDSGATRAPITSPPVRAVVCQAAPGASTRAMVEGVAARRERARLVSPLIDWIGRITREATAALEAGDWATLGELMDLNHGALCALGVSTEALDAAVHVARAAGALGAKLTGAGGGGCVWALTPDDPEPTLEALRARGWDPFVVTLRGRDPHTEHEPR